MRLIQCIRGPRLRRLYYVGPESEGSAYVPNRLEQYADNVILVAQLLFSFALYATPLYAVYYLVRHGVPSVSGVLSSVRTLTIIPVLSFSIAYLARGVGRVRNQTYSEFLRALNSANRLKKKMGPTEAKTTRLAEYDFDMTSHPVTFRHDESAVKPLRIMSSRRRGLLERLQRLPLSLLRGLAAHYIARRLIYPGSVSVYKLLISDSLSAGRAGLKRHHDAHRARLLAADGNSIDCMFVDKRGSPDSTAHGNRLVICCEGNAAFYEMGMMEIPIGVGYSVLGWNHPGFGDSTGLPFPSQEFNAVDVVVRYAVTDLGFTFQDIILFAWSIGGYSASCAAMSYPDIGAVIVDASFDDLCPLVENRVHPLLRSFSRGMVKEFYDLNISEQLCRYPGPIIVVRRLYDEMMSEESDLQSNRGNYLLINILQNRYPKLVFKESRDWLQRWLEAETDTDRILLTSRCSVNAAVCSSRLKTYMAEFGPSYPWAVGDKLSQAEKIQLLLYLAGQYMLHFDATHCASLPSNYFRVPSAGNIKI